MSGPTLNPELSAAPQVLEDELGSLQVLDVHPTPPRRPACPPTPAAAGPERVQSGLFDPTPTRSRRTLARFARPLSPTARPRPGGTADELV